MSETPIDPKLARAVLDRDRYLKAINDAFDALRDGQLMLGMNILSKVLEVEQ